MTENERLSEELQRFEAELRSLKPVRPDVVAFDVVGQTRPRQQRRNRKVLLATGSVIAALTTLAASILLAWIALRSPVEHTSEPVGPLPNGYIVEKQPEMRHETLPEKTPGETTPDRMSKNRLAAIFPGHGRSLNVREQTALLIEEMQLNESAATVPARKPDYPVVVITVKTDSRPMSPEAKQAFQRRLRGNVDPDEFWSTDRADGRRYL